MILEDNKVAVFRAVVRCGGVTAASRELGVSQPAVSQALAELESSLGARLLKRDKSGIELTPDGALFLSYAERTG
ncbi:MAG: LysR family transcriptional regulator, partial [Bacteroidales bacterium]|nr:LysR family transcriptional regulator [Bacteroidales bacterium]